MGGSWWGVEVAKEGTSHQGYWYKRDRKNHCDRGVLHPHMQPKSFDTQYSLIWFLKILHSSWHWFSITPPDLYHIHFLFFKGHMQWISQIQKKKKKSFKLVNRDIDIHLYPFTFNLIPELQSTWYGASIPIPFFIKQASYSFGLPFLSSPLLHCSNFTFLYMQFTSLNLHKMGPSHTHPL